ncbi:MAG: hypothetical protein RMK19_00090 [Bacteroidia bacterium]|nr:hypothetical protein [Bacteroidia bacterium]MDW8014399.1 hypothetical protein [Bacteroidia bacterium]
MGRLQRYLRRLKPEEWEALHEAALKEIKGEKMRLLMERLRRTGVPQILSPSEKELAKRIERWIWKRAYIAQHQAHPIYRAVPLEWKLMGATLYAQKDLPEDALSLLKQLPRSPSHRLGLLTLRLNIELKTGFFQSAITTLRAMERLTKELRASIERSFLQLILDRLLREYGGSYTEVGKRLLERLERHRHWKRPIPLTPPEEHIAEINLRTLYALAKGKPEEGHQLCQSSPFRFHPTLLMNDWICSLLLRMPLSAYSQYGGFDSARLSEYDKAILLNRLLLTLLLYATPAYAKEKYELLVGLYRRSIPLPENEYVWGQLLWLGERSSEAVQVLEMLLLRVKPKAFLYLQAALLLLIIHVEIQSWSKALWYLRHLLLWLRRRERFLASAPVLARFLQQLLRAGLHSGTLRLVAHGWQQHLTEYPAERYLWEITLLPDWIQARLRQQSLHQYRQMHPRTSVVELESLLGQVLGASS